MKCNWSAVNVRRGRTICKRKRRASLLEMLEARLLLASDWTNPNNERDVNADGFVSTLDVIELVNKMNIDDMGDLAGLATPGVAPFFDVTGDGQLTPADVNAVITAINEDGDGPVISVALAHDGGFSATDRLTFSPSLTGTALDNLLGISALQASINGGAFENVPVNPDGSFRLSSDSLADGAHTFEFRAADGFNNSSTASFSFTLDTSRPSPPNVFGLTAETDSGASSADGVTNHTNPVLAGTFIGDELVAVQIQLDGETIAEVQTVADWQVALGELADGTYSLRAVAMDEAGNLSLPSEPFELVIDTVAPETPTALSITAETDTGAADDDGITQNDSPVVISAAATGDIVNLFVNDELVDQQVAASPVAFALSGLADATYELFATASDLAGNVSQPTDIFELMIDNAEPVFNAGLTGTLRQTFSALPVLFNDLMDSAAFDPASYSLNVMGGPNDGEAIGIESLDTVHLGAAVLNLDRVLPDQGYRFTINNPLFDLAGNPYTGPTTFDFVMADPPSVNRFAPSKGEQHVRLNRELVVELDEAIDPATVDSSTFYALHSGEPLSGTIRISADEKKISLFTDEILPSSATVRLMIDGNQIIGRDGLALDANGDLEPGGMGEIDFTTTSTTTIEGTGVFGYLYSSHEQNPDGSRVPIVGATLTVEGRPDLVAVTDSEGRFQLDDVPFPEFFVDINGMTATSAPEGYFYGRVPKPFHSVAGHVVQVNKMGMPFDIFLPLIAEDDAIPLNSGEMTMAGFSANALSQLAEITPQIDPTVWEVLQVEVPPDSLYFEDGTPATEVRVFPLDREKIPVPLPDHSNPTIVFSVEAGGATNFDVPAKITYPNVDNLPPGAQRFIYSFDHDAGQWRPTGTMTVTADGTKLVSDQGVQTLGWRYVGPDPDTDPEEPDEEKDPCEGFSFDDAWAIGKVLVTAISEIVKIGPLLKSGYTAIDTVVSLRNQLSTLANSFEDGSIDRHEVTSALEVLSKTKNSAKDIWSNFTVQNPVDKAISVGKAAVNIAKEIVDRINSRGEDCLGFTWNRVLSLASRALQLGNDLLANAEDLSKSIREAPLTAACLIFDELVRDLRLATPPPQNVQAPPPSGSVSSLARASADDEITDEELLQRLRAFVDEADHFVTEQTGALDPIDGALSAMDEEFNDAKTTAVDRLIIGFRGFRNAYWRMTVGAFETRGRTSAGGELNLPTIAANSDYRLEIYSDVNNAIAVSEGVSASPGRRTTLAPFVIHSLVDAPDADGDRLADAAEDVIGTGKNNPDTDNDGITDKAEVEQSLNPLDGLGFPIGRIGEIKLRGEAWEVVVEGSVFESQVQTAYVATGFHGLAIVDTTRFNEPILLGQLALPGDNRDVSVDDVRKIAAVSAGNRGFHLVDVSDPVMPVLNRTVTIAGAVGRLEVLDGVVYAAGKHLTAVDIFTGERIETVDLGSPVKDVAREGLTLVAITDDGQLHTIDLSGSEMEVRGSVGIPASSRAVFVGNGIAYVSNGGVDDLRGAPPGSILERGGYSTFDVSDLENPTLISGVDTPAVDAGNFKTVVNGSGLALIATAIHGLDIFDASDPDDTYEFLNQYALPGNAVSVASVGGLAFVASYREGLQIVNYLPFDVDGIPPQVTITAPGADLDPNVPGIQVLEGTTFSIVAEVTDDVQVRNVELLVNGEIIRNDVSFPFDASVMAPNLSEADEVRVQVRATDTGGNTTISDPIIVDIVPDTFPPEVELVTPSDGSIRGNIFRTVRVGFSEAMDTTSLDGSSIQLIPMSDPGNPLMPVDIQYRNDDTLVQLTYAAVDPGDYTIQLDTGVIADRAGNVIGGDNLSSSFTVLETNAVFINGDGGDWHDPNNWEGMQLPGPDDNVFISLPPDTVVTHSQGDTQVNSITSFTDIELTGGSLDVSAFVEIEAEFLISGGTLRNVTLSGTPSVPPVRIADFASATFENVDVRGKVIVGPGAELNVVGGMNVGGRVTLDDATLHASGSQVWTGKGVIQFGRRNSFGSPEITGPTFDVLTIAPGLTIESHTGGSIGSVVLQGTAINRGFSPLVFQGLSATIVGTIDAAQGDIVFSNTTNFDRDTGTLAGGVWRAGPNASIELTGADVLVNEAQIALRGGQAKFRRDASASALSNLTENRGTLTLLNGAELITTSGPFANTGSLEIGVGSQLQTGGDFSQTPAGSTTLGLSHGGGSGQIVVGGAATFAGVLHLNLPTGFDPELGTFPLVSYASHSNAFSSITGIPAGFPFQPIYGISELVLVAGSTFDDAAALPYTQRFDSPATIGDEVTAISRNGNIAFSPSFGPRTQPGHAVLTTTTSGGTTGTNELTIALDVAGHSQLELNFYHKADNETGDVLAATFVGSSDGDGVSISTDGIHWHRIVDLSTALSGDYQQFTIDLDAAAAAAGLTLDDKLAIRFQQTGASDELSTARRMFDDIQIGADAVGPRVEAVIPQEPLVFSAAMDQLSVTFDSTLDASSAIDPENFSLTGAGPDGVFGTGDDVAFILTPSFDGNRTVHLTVTDGVGGALTLPTGLYAVTISGANTVTDENGVPLNDGLDETFAFEVFPPESPANDTLGTATDTGVTALGGKFTTTAAIGNNAGNPAELDVYEFSAAANQFLRVSATPISRVAGLPSTDLQVRLLDAGGNELQSYNSPDVPGVVFTTTLPSTGAFFLEVSSTNLQPALYQMNLDLLSAAAMFPLVEDFSSGSLGDYWETVSSPGGRIRVTDVFGGGNFELVADADVPADPWLLVYQDYDYPPSSLTDLGLVEGVDFEVKLPGEFAAMTPAEIAAFKTIFVPSFVSNASGLRDDHDGNGITDLQEVLSGVGTTGRAVLSGLHVDSFGGTEREQFLRDAFAWLRGGTTTGLLAVVDDTNFYDWSPWADALADKVTFGFGSDCSILPLEHPVTVNLNDAEFQCLADNSHYDLYFTSDIPGFTTLIVDEDQPDRRLVLASGTGTNIDPFAIHPPVLNEAILHIDLSGQSNVELQFTAMDFGDRSAIEVCPAMFSGSEPCTAVSYSENGIQWYNLFGDDSFSPFYSERIRFAFDLDEFAARHGISLGPLSQIKFQDFGNGPAPFDGFLIDDVRVVTDDQGPEVVVFDTPIETPRPQDFVLAELNGDNFLDGIIVSNADGQASVSTILGNGDGTFQRLASVNVPERIVDLFAGAIDSTPGVDLLLFHDDAVSVSSGNNDGTFAPPQITIVDLGIASGTTGFVNDDAFLDIVVFNSFTYNSVQVLLGDGTGGFNPQDPIFFDSGGAAVSGGANATELEFAFFTPAIKLADVVGDGALDLIVGREFPAGITIFQGDNAGGFGSPLDIPLDAGGGFLNSDSVGSIEVGDFNNDQMLDIVAVNGGSEIFFFDVELALVVADGMGGFTAQPPIFVGYNNNERINPPVLKDINNDQDLDILLPTSFSEFGQAGGDAVTALLGGGDATFTQTRFFTGANPIAVAAEDLTNNGVPDVVTLNRGYQGAVIDGEVSMPSVSVIVTLPDGSFSHGTLSSPVANARVVQGSTDFSSIFVEFSEVGMMDTATSGDAANYEIRFAGPDGMLGTADDPMIPVNPIPSSDPLFPNRVTLMIDQAMFDQHTGLGRITINGTSSVRDADGNPLGDRDGDGVGEDFVYDFEIVDNGPVVVEQTPSRFDDILPGISEITVRFSETIDPATFTTDDILGFQDPSGDPIVPTGVSVNGDEATITFPAQTELGWYAFTIGPDVLDTLGQPMNQDYDFQFGEATDDQYFAFFEVSLRNRWNNPDGGSWHDPANWTTGVVPDATHEVSILAPGTYTITAAAPIAFDTLTLNSVGSGTPTLSIEENLALANSTTVQSGTVLNVAATKTLNIDSAFHLNGGTVSGGGIVNLGAASDVNFNSGTISGLTITDEDGATFDAFGGTLDGATLDADLTVNSFRTLHVTGGLTLHGTITLYSTSSFTPTTLRFSGDQTLDGSGEVLMSGSFSSRVSQVVPADDGTLTIGSGITIRNTARGTVGDSTLSTVNHGTIISDGASAELTLRGDQFINHGTLATANGGQLTLNDNWANPGTINLPSGRARFAGSFQAAEIGTVNNTGGTIVIAGNLDNIGQTLTLNSSTGSWELEGSYFFDGSYQGGTIVGGTIATADGAELRVSSFSDGLLDGVTIDGVVSVLNGGDLVVRNGLTVNGTLRVENNFSTTDVIVAGNQTFDGTGQIVLTGTSTFQASRIDVPAAAVLTIGENLTVDAQMSGQVGSVGVVINEGTLRSDVAGQTLVIAGAGLINRGTIAATNGATVSIGASNWQNEGAINVADSTLNLGGTFAIGTAGTINQSNSTVNLTGVLENFGSSLVLNNTTGSWNLNGGTIRGGTLDFADGQTLVIGSNSNNRLDGVTINGDLTMGVSSVARVANGLTLNGTINMTSSSTSLGFEGTQTLAGTGEIFFDPATFNHYLEMAEPGILTIGPNIVIRGGNGRIGGSWWFGRDMAVVNQGTIISDTPNRSITVDGRNGFVTNEGIMRADGGNLDIDHLSGDAGTIQVMAGGTADLSGNFTLSGNTTVNDATLTLSGTWSNTGTISVVDAPNTLNLNGDWDNNGTINVTGATVNLGGTFTTADLGMFNVDDSAVNIIGQWDNTGHGFVLDADAGWRLRQGGQISGGSFAPGDVGQLNATGKHGSALELTGQPNAVMLPHELLDGQTDVTIEFWYKTEKTTRQDILTGAYTNHHSVVDIFLNSDTRVNFGSDSWDVASSLADNAWHHYSFVRDDVNNEISFYLDGILQGTKSRNLSTIDIVRDGLILGQFQNSIGGDFHVNYFADGTLDEFRVWEFARQAVDIAADYDSVLAGHETGLRGYYRFEDSTGVTIADTSGSFDGRLSTRLVIDDHNSNNRLNNVTFDSDLDVTGRVSVNQLTVNGNAWLDSGSVLDFEGDQTLDGTGVVAFGGSGNGHLRTSADGTLTVGANMTIRGGYGIIGGGSNMMNVNNLGTINADLPNRYIRAWGNSGTVMNQGTFAAEDGGTLDADNLTGNFANAAASEGGILEFDGTYTIQGTVDVNGATLTTLGAWNSTGTIKLSEATANFDGTFSTAALGTLDSTNATINLRGTLDNSGATLTTEADDTWRLDDGTIIGGTIAAGGLDEVSTTGRIGNAIEFVGNYTAVQLPGETVNGLTDGTFEFWYKTDRPEYQTIFNAKHPNGSSDQLGIYLVNNTTFRFGSDTWTLPTSVDDGTWHHYAVVRDDTANMVSFYFDGSLVETKTRSMTALAVHDRGVVLGQYPGTLLSAYDQRYPARGILDDFRIWDTLRSETEINDNMNAPLTGSEQGLRGYWKFDETTGGTLADATPAGNAGSMDVRFHVTGDYDNLLDGVTVAGNLDMSFNSSARTRVINGLTVNGMVYMGSSAALGFDGDQSLDGTGGVHFNTGNSYFVMASPGTLTIGADTTVFGGGAILGDTYGPWNGDMNIVNQGTIRADVSGRTLTVKANNGTVTNSGTLEAVNGGILDVQNLIGNAGAGAAEAGGFLIYDGTYSLVGNQTVQNASLNLFGAWSNAAMIDITAGGTANLDGTFTTSDLGTINAHSSTVNIRGVLDNSGQTLTPTAEGTWRLDDGEIIGGSIGAGDLTTATTTGRIGNAIEFVGNYTAVQLPGETVNGLTDGTFEFWYKTDRPEYQTIFNAKHPNGSSDQLGIYLENNTTFRFGSDTWTLPASVDDGTWHHYAVVRDDTANMVSFYFDGSLVETKTRSMTALAVHDRGVVLGQYPGTLLSAYDQRYPARGILDDFRIWDTLRSETEINDNMNAPLTGSEQGLRGYWKFDETTGSTLADATPAGNAGSIDVRFHVTGDYDNLLDGVTVGGNLDMSFNSSARTRVTNGLTVNGMVYMGSSAALGFDGDQSLDGTGGVHFNTGNSYFVMASPGTLTIGADTTVFGGGAILGDTYGPWNGDMNIVNQGTVRADVHGRTIFLRGRNGTVTSNGVFEAVDGGKLDAENLVSSVGGGLAENGGILEYEGTYTLAQNHTVNNSTINLLGNWSNAATIDMTAATANLDGSFTTAGLGNISSASSTVNLTGHWDNSGATFSPPADGNWWLNDGTLTGGTIVAGDLSDATAAGRLGNSLEFFGSRGTNVQIPGAALDGVTDATIEFWYKTTKTGNQGILSGLGPNSSSSDVTYVWFEHDQRLWFEYRVWDLAASIADGTWHHFAIVRDDTNNLGTLYVDGVSQGTQSVSYSALDIHERGILLGQEQSSLNTGFTINDEAVGLIDELRIWDKARSEAEIMADYQQALVGNEADLRAYWRFEETTGTTLTDLAGGYDAAFETRLLITADSDNLLDGITVDGALDLTNGSSRTRVANGLDINGTVYLNSSGSLGFDGSQTLGGTGDVEFGTGTSYLEMFSAGTLTIGPNLTVSGGEARIGDRGWWNVQSHVVNNGTIRADISGRTIELTENMGGSATSNGVLEATNGGTLKLEGNWSSPGMLHVVGGTVNLHDDFTTADLGTVSGKDGHVNINGDWDNTGATFELNAGIDWLLNGSSITGGTLNPGGLETLATSGQIGGGLLLEPTVTSVNLPANVFNGLTDTTIEFWYKTEKTGFQSILQGSQPQHFEDFYIWLNHDRRVNFDGWTFDLAESVADGQWHHYAFTREAATNELRFFLDGVQNPTMYTNHTAVPWLAYEGGVVLGQEADAIAGSFDANEAASGAIDDFRVWDTVRTPQEVADHRSAALAGNETGLRAYWKFDETTGTTLADATANNFHAALDVRLIIGNNNENLLDSVTVNSGLEFPYGSARTRVNNLTLNGTANMSSSTMGFEGDQTLAGTGVVFFSSTSEAQLVTSAPGTLTIGPGMTIHGLNGRIGANRFWNEDMNVVNQGTIEADGRNYSIKLWGHDEGSGDTPAVMNTGTLRASNGGTLDVDHFVANLNGAAVDGGTLEVDGAFTVNQNVPVDNGGTLTFTGTWTNNATIDVNDSPDSFNMFGDWNNNGTINATNSTVNIDGDFTTAELGTFHPVGTTVNILGTWDNTGATYELAPGGTWWLDGASLIGGTINNGSVASISTAGPGSFGNALDLQGGLNPVSLPAAAVNGLTDATVEFWYKTGETRYQMLLGGGNQSSVDVVHVTLENNATRLRFDGRTWDLAAPVADDTWHHYALTRNATTNQVEFFLDGVSQGTQNLTISPWQVIDGSFFIGQRQFGIGGGGFRTQDAADGQLDDLRIWNTVRSQAEIDAARSLPLTGLEPGLYTYYKFEETTGTTFADSTANNHDASSDTRLNITADSGNQLTGVTLNTGLDLSRSNARTKVTSGLTINDVAYVGTGSTFGLDGDQTVGGIGQIWCNGTSWSHMTAATNATLTIGPDLLVRGGWCRIGGTQHWNANLSVVNQGTINGDFPNSIFEVIGNNGTVTNTGTIRATIGNVNMRDVASNSGTLTIAPGKTIAVDGALPLTGSSVIQVDINGTNNNQIGKLAVSGAVTLAGTLNARFVDAFEPAAGNGFVILTFASRSGTFATEQITNEPAGVDVTVQYNAGDVTLAAAAAVQSPSGTPSFASFSSQPAETDTYFNQLGSGNTTTSGYGQLVNRKAEEPTSDTGDSVAGSHTDTGPGDEFSGELSMAEYESALDEVFTEFAEL